MSEQRPKPPELVYARPQARPNSPRSVVLRMIFSGLLGTAATILASVLADSVRPTSDPQALLLFFTPLAVLLGVACFLAWRARCYGYGADVIIGPFIVAAAAVEFLVLICRGPRF